MDVTEIIRERVNEFSSWGDVLAACYVLLESIVLNEGLFQAQYLGECQVSAEVNPNLARLQELEDIVRGVAE